MKFLVVGDTHYTNKNVRETEAMEKEIDRVAAIHKPDVIVFLGDTLDKNSKIDMNSQQRAQNYMNALSLVYPIVLLIGNHDRVNNEDFMSPNHPFSGMECKKNVVVVSSTVVKSYGDIRVCYVPYVPNGRFAEAIATKIKTPEDVDVFFAHQDFVRIIGRGDEWHIDNPPVISGHIHKQYRGLERKDNIIYPGAPLCHNFGDDEDRYLMVYETKLEVTAKGEEVIKDSCVFEQIHVPVRAVKKFILPLQNYSEVEKFLVGREKLYTRIDITGSIEDIDEFRRKFGAKCEINPSFVGMLVKPYTENGDLDEVNEDEDDISGYKFSDLLSVELDNYDLGDGDMVEYRREALEKLRKSLSV